MNEYISYVVQILSAGVGSLGFALLFNLGKKNLISATVGGMASWLVYLLCFNSGLGYFLSAVVCSGFCQIYSEIFARIKKAPATVFYIPTIVPLVPGGGLYYTMYYATRSDWVNFRSYGWQTLQVALGIAVGASFVSAILLLLPRKK